MNQGEGRLPGVSRTELGAGGRKRVGETTSQHGWTLVSKAASAEVAVVGLEPEADCGWRLKVGGWGAIGRVVAAPVWWLQGLDSAGERWLMHNERQKEAMWRCDKLVANDCENDGAMGGWRMQDEGITDSQPRASMTLQRGRHIGE